LGRIRNRGKDIDPAFLFEEESPHSRFFRDAGVVIFSTINVVDQFAIAEKTII
jgi:hypothetical protein